MSTIYRHEAVDGRNDEHKHDKVSEEEEEIQVEIEQIPNPENDKIFTLAAITSMGDLEAAREVDLNKATDEELFNKVEDAFQRDEEGKIIAQGEEDDIDGKTASIKAQMTKAEEQAKEDEDMMETDTKEYAKMLREDNIVHEVEDSSKEKEKGEKKKSL